MKTNEIELAPPGAGLPWLELQIARLIFRRARKRSSRGTTDALLDRETRTLEQIAGALPVDTASKQVLIRRLPGLEDSSRNWSVFMTLEHLAIVNEGVAGVITALANGIEPPGAASTASVKPHVGADASVVQRFLAATEAVRNAARGVPDLETKARYAHPWFGRLNAAEWHFMAAFHQRLHRRQVEEILRKA